MVDLQVKVVDSLSPCFRGDFPESVTADRYVTSEWEDPWKHLKNGKPWAPHHPWTCESSPQSPQTETYSTVNTARARCEDVTSECSRPQNVIQMIHFIFESMKYTTWYSQRLVLLSDRTKDLVFPKRKTTPLSNSLILFRNLRLISWDFKFPPRGILLNTSIPSGSANFVTLRL